MKKKVDTEAAVHNACAEPCMCATQVDRPFGPVITPEEMEVIHKMEEDMFKREPECGPGGHEAIVDEPQHYKHSTFEVIDEMVLAFGIDATINFCILNAWKYRARAPYKGKMEQDMEKADRYMQYAHDLQLKKVRRDTGRSSHKLPLLKSSGRDLVSDGQAGEG